MADIDDCRRGPVGSDEKLRNFPNRLLRGGKTNADRYLMRECLQAFQRKREVSAALVVGDGVDFVDDHCGHVTQNRAALVGSEQDVERFGSCYQNVRRALQHGAALGHQRIAGAHSGPDFRHEQALLACVGEDLAEGAFKVLLDVVAERLERGNVENFRAVLQIAAGCLANEPVDANEERRQGFS